MKKTLLLLAAVLSAAISFAQTDFSGRWNLNSSKSQLGERSFAPASMVLTQDAANLKVESHMSWQDQDFTTNDKFTLDGKECLNPGMMESQKKSTVSWSDDKKTLSVVTKIAFQDQEMTLTERYSLSEGALKVVVTMSSSFGEMSETRMYDKI